MVAAKKPAAKKPAADTLTPAQEKVVVKFVKNGMPRATAVRIVKKNTKK